MNHEEKQDWTLDRAIREVRDEPVDPAAAAEAAARVWSRISREAQENPVEHIRGCEDFRALMPDARAGRLPAARLLLLKDHLRECIACRKLFNGEPARVTEMPRPAAARPPVWRWAVAAALTAGVGLTAWTVAGRLWLTPDASAVVQNIHGTIYRVSDRGLEPLAAGAEVPAGAEVRTAKDSDAMLRLGDGSLVEVRERSGLAVTAGIRELNIRLMRGSVIVQAAKRRSGHLFVATPDCRVAVTGTVFNVNSGTKGSRVSVIEGEVRVTQNRSESVLRPGDQYSSSPSVEAVPVRDEIAWSRHLDQHLALMREFAVLRKQLDRVPAPELRYSSRLLGRLPAGTVVYAAFPNLGRSLGEAHQILRQRVQESPALREWWEERVESGANFDALLESLRGLSEYLGDEIVLAAATGPNGRIAAPVMMAEVKRDGLREFAAAAFSAKGISRKPLRFASGLAELDGARSGEPVVLLHNGLAALSPDPSALRGLAAAPEGGLASTPFGARVAEAYRGGAGVVIAADLERVAGKGREHAHAGFANLRHLVIEQRAGSGQTATHAELVFQGQRQGMAAWLAAPAPLAAADFFSPEAGFVAAFAITQPAVLLDQLLEAHPEARDVLAKMEAQTGLRLRDDVLAGIGGEAAVGLDGPALPTPSWKLAVEVYDPARLQYSIGKLVEAANRAVAARQSSPLTLRQETAGGRTWYTLSVPGAGPLAEAHYVFADGYLLAAPSRALIERALEYRRSGNSLTRASSFTSLVPRDRHANFSAMMYQNLGPVIAPFADLLQGALSEDHKKAVAGVAAEWQPMLVTAYGDADRITLASTSSQFGLNAANFFGMRNSLSLLQMMGRRGGERRSK